MSIKDKLKKAGQAIPLYLMEAWLPHAGAETPCRHRCKHWEPL
jgi:hypothetical protein